MNDGNGSCVGRPTYRITVRGTLSEGFATAFEGMTLEAGRGETTLLGDLEDQSQLFGVIDRVRDFGLDLIRVERVCP